jgi:hypothetical protein
MPTAQLERGGSSSRISLADDVEDMQLGESSSSAMNYKRPIPSMEHFSPSAVLMSMARHSGGSQSSSSYSIPRLSSHSQTSSPSPVATYSHPATSYNPDPLYPRPSPSLPASSSSSGDPFQVLRRHNLHTKSAWTVISASEGFRILDLCKSLSVTQSENNEEVRVPCYNRETIFDEEWQAHMKDVHGVFLLWPETWMRRIEVLDLDAFGGDVGACNEVIMEG